MNPGTERALVRIAEMLPRLVRGIEDAATELGRLRRLAEAEMSHDDHLKNICTNCSSQCEPCRKCGNKQYCPNCKRCNLGCHKEVRDEAR